MDGIKGSPQTPLLEYKIELCDDLPLKSNPYIVEPILEEIARGLIQEYVDSGFYIKGESEYVSPCFVFIKPRRTDDPHLESLKQYFHKNFIMPRDRTMHELIKALEEYFTCRLVVDFRELNKRVVPDPYILPRPKEIAMRMGMDNKPFKTVLDFMHGFGAMGYYKGH